MQSLRQREDFRVVTHTQAGEKEVSSLKEHDEEFGKTGRDLRCLCALRFSVSHISWQRGEQALKQSDYREVITSYPPFLSVILSTSVFSLSAAHTDQTLLSRTLFLHRYEYQSAGLKMWSCYCRSTVCTNREGDMYLTQRGHRIMMSSGNISAKLSQPSNPLFLLSSRQKPTRAVIVTAQQSCYSAL